MFQVFVKSFDVVKKTFCLGKDGLGNFFVVGVKNFRSGNVVIQPVFNTR